MSRNFELLQSLGFADPVTATAPAVERVIRRPMVAPEVARRTARVAPDPHAAGIVQRLYLATDGGAPTALSFISMEETNNDTLCGRVAEQLAAQIAGSICVVDANLGHPALHTHFGLPNDRGLAESLATDAPIGAFGRRIAGTDLTIITAGRARPAACSERLAERIREMREQFDYLLVRAPGGTHPADACFLARLTGSAVLVIEAHATRRDRAAHLKLQLTQNGVSVLGAVLNNRTFPVPQKLYAKLF